MTEGSEKLPLDFAPFNNRRLFSDHFLGNLLPAWEEFQNNTQCSAPAAEQIQALYVEKKHLLKSANEAQTEKEFIQPILDILGWQDCYIVQAPVKDARGRPNCPDYAMFADSDSKNSGYDQVKINNYRSALAVADAKFWERALDNQLSSKRDTFSNVNPAFQIINYLTATQLNWGILTNGRHWRLHSLQASAPLDEYFEIDLLDLIDSQETAGWDYFVAFFSKGSFIRDASEHCFLDRVFSESEAHAVEVEDNLRDRAYDSVHAICSGFCDSFRVTHKRDPNEDELGDIYTNALTYLYRLLFVLFAEARELLPMHASASYRKGYSLTHTLEVILDYQTQGLVISKKSDNWYNDLKALFRIVDEGDEDLGVPAYNGGLFNTVRHPFLEQHGIADFWFATAAVKLARIFDKKLNRDVFVDYRSLSTRQLGSIYEALLEFKAKIADVDLTEKASKGKAVVLTKATAQDTVVVPAGTIYLQNDKGERKASGSYYTPAYIVRFIVEQTVRTLVQQVRTEIADQLTEIDAQVKKATGAKKKSCLEKQKSIQAQVPDHYFGLRVLDPAMGSGHFLVEVVRVIAEAILEDPNYDPGERTEVHESDFNTFARKVVENCIYGVDINPLAVELAKLSLWLTTASRDRPLSFLDHHLRCGNTLVGARDVQDLGSLVTFKGGKPRRHTGGKQISSFEHHYNAKVQILLGFIRDIEQFSSDTIADIKNKESLFAEAQKLVSRFWLVADVWAGYHFAGQADNYADAHFADLQAQLSGSQKAWQAISTHEWVTTTQQQAAQLNPFHWPLAFPDVFFDLHREPGFDAIVGNPPYVRQEQLGEFKPYYECAFETYHGVADIYVYFFEQALALLRKGGMFGYISSGSFFRGNFGEPLRAFLGDKSDLHCVLDFGDFQPFRDAEINRPSIICASKLHTGTAPVQVFINPGKDHPGVNLNSVLQDNGFSSQQNSLNDDVWVFEPVVVADLRQRLLKESPAISSLSGIGFYRGVLTGLNEAFVIDNDTKNNIVQADSQSAEIIKPFLQGEDLKPWHIDDQKRWLIFTRRGINIDHYPGVQKYLSQFRQQLEPKPTDWPSKKKWEGRKPGSYHWYEIQDSIDYYKEFERPKIVWPDIAKVPRFNYDEEHFYLGNTGYILPTDSLYLLGVLNSKVIWFLISGIAQPLMQRAGLWRYRLIYQFIQQLPIPNPSQSQEQKISDRTRTLVDLGRERRALEREVRNRLFTDLAAGETVSSRSKLYDWPILEFTDIRKELKRNFDHDIPVAERGEWETYIGDRRSKVDAIKATMAKEYCALHDDVYDVFGCTEGDREIIEEQTNGW